MTGKKKSAAKAKTLIKKKSVAKPGRKPKKAGQKKFNTCPACFRKNRLSAAYCSECGAVLEVKAEPAGENEDKKENEIKYYIEGQQALPEPGKSVVLFDIYAVISSAVNKYKKNFIILFLFGLIGTLPGEIINLYFKSSQPAFYNFFLILLNLLFTAYSQLLIYITLDFTEEKGEPGFSSAGGIFKASFEKFGTYLWAVIRYGLTVMLGILLLIVPGIIWRYKYYFVGILSAVEDDGKDTFFEKSGVMTEGYKWNIFCCNFVAGLAVVLIYLGMLALVYFGYLISGIHPDKGVFSATELFCVPLITPFYSTLIYSMYKVLKIKS